MEEKLCSSVYNGRPFGGTGILIRNQMSKFVMPVITGSPQVTALRLFNVGSQDIVVCSIYTVSGKKVPLYFFPITLPNLNRSS